MKGAEYTVFDTAGVVGAAVRSRDAVAIHRRARDEVASDASSRHVLVSTTDEIDALQRATRLRKLAGRRFWAMLVFPRVGAARADFLAAHERTTSVVGAQSFHLVPDRDALGRIVTALRHGAERARDLPAWAYVADEGRTLVVVTCMLEREEFDLGEVPALGHLAAAQRAQVVMDGWWLHWPDVDAHLDLSTLRELTGQRAPRDETDQAAAYWQRYGRAVRAVRERHGVKQSDVQGLTARQVRRIELGESRPRLDTLRKLAAAHGLELSRYLDVVAAEVTERE